MITEVGAPSKFTTHFTALLHESWSIWRAKRRGPRAAYEAGPATPPPEDRELAPVETVDLWAFCEVGACWRMPPGCAEVPLGQRVAAITGDIGRCFYTFLPANFSETNFPRLHYRFLPSLTFQALDEVDRVLQQYDYVMRTDADAAVSEAVFDWYPPEGAAFGSGYMGWRIPETPSTYPWLEEVAGKLGMQHHHVHGMQSTYYIPSHMSRAFSSWMVNLTVYLLENEFTPEMCERKQRSSLWANFYALDASAKKKQVQACRWPFWHFGVATLYAQNLVVNHLLPETGLIPNDRMVTNKLDVGGNEFFQNGDGELDQVQGHYIQLKHGKPLSSPLNLVGAWLQMPDTDAPNSTVKDRLAAKATDACSSFNARKESGPVTDPDGFGPGMPTGKEFAIYLPRRLLSRVCNPEAPPDTVDIAGAALEGVAARREITPPPAVSSHSG